MPDISPEGVVAPEPEIARTIKSVPYLKEGFVRLVHVSANPKAEEAIRSLGLDYSRQGMVTSTARVFSNEGDVKYFTPEDQRFSSGASFVFDMPVGEYKVHNDVQKSPGVIPSKFLVGVIKKE